jgi:A/G-specific adenine glycosylase
MDNDDTKRAEFARRLLDWYARQNRDLPWRRTRDPYAIWVSETMLQQTQVATVIPYWTHWMARFPTVRALAEAAGEDVLKAWQGLGYYARARNLHRAAQTILEKHGGVFPTRFEDVLALPGVGRYTAGAVCSIAFGQDVPVVDANVIRVLCRVFGVRGNPKSSATQAALWELAQALVPAGRASAFNQGLMELGALVCHAAPRCPACPAQELCVACASGSPTSLPEFAPRPVFTSQTDVSAIVRHPRHGRLLLAQRPAHGLWGGLWEFPRVTLDPNEAAEAGAERAARQVVGIHARAGERVGVVKHGVTTRRITLIGIACAPQGAAEPAARDCAAWVWVKAEDLDTYPSSSPQRRLRAQVRAARDQPTLFEVPA